MEASHVLIVAPIGAYMGRVKSGVEWVLGHTDSRPNETEIRLIFAVSRVWLGAKEYNAEIERLMNGFLEPALREQFKKLEVERQEVDVDEQTSCTVWLLQILGEFLQSTNEGVVYADLTSGPKEWMFACEYAAQFFDRIVLYYVKSKFKRSFADFAERERDDEGAIPEVIHFSAPDPALTNWVMKGTSNWSLFRVLFAVAGLIARKEKKPIDRVEIPLEELAKYASEWVPTAYQRRKEIEIADALKSISKRLTQIRRYGLFTENKHTISFTARGYALAKSMFPTVLEPKKSTMQST